MEDASLVRALSQSNLSKGRVLIPGKAVYVKKRTRITISSRTKKTMSSEYEYIILLHEGKRVGGILICGAVDLHIMIFKKYRAKGFMSSFLKSGWIRKLNPKLKELTTKHSPQSTEYKIVKHFAKILKVPFRRV